MKTRVAVIYGGRTGEHEVSVRSAKSILQGLDPAKYEKIEYFIGKDGKWSPRPILPEHAAATARQVGSPEIGRLSFMPYFTEVTAAEPEVLR